MGSLLLLKQQLGGEESLLQLPAAGLLLAQLGPQILKLLLGRRGAGRAERTVWSLQKTKRVDGED